jgi:hypothetical protein
MRINGELTQKLTKNEKMLAEALEREAKNLKYIEEADSLLDSQQTKIE